MDITALTSALTKTLARYSEAQDTDRLKRLPRDIGEAVIAHELSRDIETLLAAQPEFRTNRMVNSPNGRMGFACRFVAPMLVCEGRRRGAGAAVEWLTKVLSTKKARGFVVQALRGIRVASVTSLVDDIDLVPFDALPDSRQKQGLSVSSHAPHQAIPIYAFELPSAALVVPIEIEPFLVESDKADTPRPGRRAESRVRFEDIRHCLALVNRAPIVSGPSWFHYEDSDLEAAVLGSATSFSHQEVVPQSISDQGEIDAEQARATVCAYFALDEGARQRVRTALERVHLAFIRSVPADKTLELAIALETLLVDSPGENTFKISLRAALLTAEDINSRATNRAIIRAAYSLRSALMHSGQSRTKVTVPGEGEVPSTDVAERATVITIDVIRSVLTAGKLPDWSDVELSPRGASAF